MPNEPDNLGAADPNEHDQDALDQQTLAAIAKADAEYDRGEYVEWRDVRDALRRKYLGKP